MDAARFVTGDLARLRSLFGASTALWAGEAGVRVEPERWVALSGARAVDFNLVLCHGASAGQLLPRSLEEIAAAGEPALVMVAGEALGAVQRLIDAGWVCVGTAPFMAQDLDRHAGGAGVQGRLPARRLEVRELGAARALVEEAFGTGPDLARVALPSDAVTRPGQSVWGAFDEGGELASCLVAVRAQEAVVIWSMATAARARQRGHGACLLSAALADAARSGARLSLLRSSRVGEPFYRAFGYGVLELWQLWSRPRWMLAN